MKILISGAGIAGPALALCLKEQGHQVTVVERAPRLREGGQSVDFRGAVHRQVLERLQLWAPIWQRRTSPSPLAFIDARGEVQALLPAMLTAGDVEIVRGDLCRLLHGLSAPFTEYRFGDHPTGVAQTPAEARVTFASGREEAFDLVVGADGLHSGVRALAFGPEAHHVRHHDYGLATFSFDRFCELEGATKSYAEPGRSLTLSAEPSGRARALLIFTSPPLGRERPEQLRALVKARYAGCGWEAERVLARLDTADDLYVDAIATVRTERYVNDRVVLLGDAAWGGTLGGQGTPLAIVGAFVLANELRLGATLSSALTAFEARMRPYASGCQKTAERAGPFHAPKTRLGLVARTLFYRALTSRPLLGQFEKMVKASASAFELPAY